MISGIIHGNMPGYHSGLMYISTADPLGHFACGERVSSMEAMDPFPPYSTVMLNTISGFASATPMDFTDSTLDPRMFTTDDGCTFTTGWPPSFARIRAMSIRPNRTPGRFTVEFADPLLRDRVYSVFDATGRLPWQRPLPTGATLEEIDPARFGRGTSVLRVSDPEGGAACTDAYRQGGGGVTWRPGKGLLHRWH